MKESPMVTKMKLRLQQNNKVNYKDFGIPKTNGLDTPMIKDVLETEVDEKFYLSQEKTDKLISLSKISSMDRKALLKGKPHSEDTVNTISGEQFIATRNLSRNGKLTSDIAPTIQASETPHIVEGQDD